MIFTCRQLAAKESEAREGQLSALERATYRMHVAWCRACRRYLGRFDRIIDAARAAVRERRAPDELRARIRDEAKSIFGR